MLPGRDHLGHQRQHGTAGEGFADGISLRSDHAGVRIAELRHDVNAKRRRGSIAFSRPVRSHPMRIMAGLPGFGTVGGVTLGAIGAGDEDRSPSRGGVPANVPPV